MVFNGQLTRWFRFFSQFEFQNNETDNLLDAYVEAVMGRQALRFGQYKSPFSLQWQTADKAILFTERAISQSLSPQRVVGAMLAGTLGPETFHYSAGFFNAEGDDGSDRGNREDAPEAAGRLVVAPLKHTGIQWLRNLQFGASGTYADIELADVGLRVKSAGMIDTPFNIYVLAHDTKFGVLQDAGSRWRLGLESAWSVGPLALQGEWLQMTYTDLEPAGAPAADAEFSSWYASAAVCLTGEAFMLSQGVLKPIFPIRNFNPTENSWGALVLAARLEHFEGDPDWITANAFVSVREADTFSVALNWILYPMARVMLDYTHTDLSDPIRIRVNPDGSVDYISEENVFTLRFGIDF